MPSGWLGDLRDTRIILLVHTRWVSFPLVLAAREHRQHAVSFEVTYKGRPHLLIDEDGVLSGCIRGPYVSREEGILVANEALDGTMLALVAFAVLAVASIGRSNRRVALVEVSCVCLFILVLISHGLIAFATDASLLGDFWVWRVATASIVVLAAICRNGHRVVLNDGQVFSLLLKTKDLLGLGLWFLLNATYFTCGVFLHGGIFKPLELGFIILLGWRILLHRLAWRVTIITTILFLGVDVASVSIQTIFPDNPLQIWGKISFQTLNPGTTLFSSTRLAIGIIIFLRKLVYSHQTKRWFALSFKRGDLFNALTSGFIR